VERYYDEFPDLSLEKEKKMKTKCIATRGPINDPFSSQQGGVD
jgi:hypothetical protein